MHILDVQTKFMEKFKSTTNHAYSATATEIKNAYNENKSSKLVFLRNIVNDFKKFCSNEIFDLENRLARLIHDIQYKNTNTHESSDDYLEEEV